jgi:lysophospholipase
MTRDVLLSLVDGDRPDDGEVKVLTAIDGIELRSARWAADPGTTAKGTVLLFHGYSEFIEKYYEVIGELRERGYAVATFDWRGQSLSERLIEDSHKGYVNSFSDFVSDAIMVLNQIVVTEMPPPYLLMAHSMGGNVALRLLMETSGRFSRCVLSAPMVGWDLGLPLGEACLAADQAVAAGLGDMYAPGATEIDLDNPLNRVTSDLERFERWMAFYRHEPRLVMAGITTRWMREGAYSTALVMDPERARRITVPTLLASAELDIVVSPTRQRELSEMSKAITLAVIPGSMHEMLMETDEIRACFWEQFDRFTA